MAVSTERYQYTAKYPHLCEQIEQTKKMSFRVWQGLRTYTEYLLPLNLKPGYTLLDLGCGTGSLDHYLAKAGVKTTGVEINPCSLAHAKIIHPEPSLNLVAADALSLPFTTNSFDVVVSQDMFEHLPDEESAADALLQMSRVCTGKLMLHKVTVLEDKDWIHADESHRIKETAAWWTDFFQRNGWRAIANPTRKYPVWSRKGIGFHTMHGYFLLERIK